jgi:excisionase family DNA binding protein
MVRELLSLQELAEYLGVPSGTIYQWRYRGVGPAGIKVGRHVRFRMSDVQRWLDEMAAVDASRSA